MNFQEETLVSKGYFHAMLDINNWFEQHSDTLKFDKMYNKKGIHSILQAMLNNTDIMQKYGEFTEFVKKEDGTVSLRQNEIKENDL